MEIFHLLLLCACFFSTGILAHEPEDFESAMERAKTPLAANPSIELSPGIIKLPCIPIIWAEPVPLEISAKVQQFQQGWFDQETFPKVKVTNEERLWLLNRTVSPLHRAQQLHPRWDTSSRQKRHATGSDPDCYEIPRPLRTRKEYRQLSSSERSSYHAALNNMKNDFPFTSDPTLSAYDFLVTLHRSSMAPAAHGGAAFLPWHREYLLVFENALFDYGYIGPGLPYWDNTLDQSLPDPSASALWTSAYMGNNNGDVTSGPAANWEVIPSCQSGTLTKLQRSMSTGSSGKFSLFSDSDINYVNSKHCFKDISCREDCTFENKHGSVHVFVGGHMQSVSCAPSDPIFYMHHAFIDCIWEDFRQHHQETDLETEYPSNTAHGDNIGWGSGLPHEWYSPMEPFDNLINAQGISNHYTNYYYECRRRPKTCYSDSQCGSSILWCDRSACRCRAKVRQGGDCTGLPHKACAGPCGFGKFARCNPSSQICDCQPFIIKDKLELSEKLTSG